MASRSLAVEFAPSMDHSFDQLWLKAQRQFSQPDMGEDDDLHDSMLDIRHSSIQSLVVTSWTEGEGTSAISLGLAARAASSIQGEVCLVDTDFRASHNLTSEAGLKNQPGLYELLEAEAELDDVLVSTSEPGLKFLPCGKAKDDEVVFTDSKIQQFVPLLEDRFRYVFFDTSCLKTGVEAYRLGRFVVNAILVVEAGTARRQTVAHAVTSMRLQGMEVLGTILNRRVDSIPGWLYRYL